MVDRRRIKARSEIADTGNELLLSLASIWEIAMKVSVNKLKMPKPLVQYIPRQLQLNSIAQLDIGFRHVARVASLPFHHRDPFDRLIIAQALEEKLPILSADPMFSRYEIQRLW